MKVFNSKAAILAAAAVLAIAALVFYMLFVPGKTAVVLSNADTGKVYACFEAQEGTEFYVSFIHSVNKSEVKEFYTVYNDGIYIEKCLYSGFGAGVATEITDGQELTYTDDGKMLISGIHRRIDKLSYIVGTVSDHIFGINGNEISLRDLCGRNSPVVFEVRNVNRFFVWRNYCGRLLR